MKSFIAITAIIFGLISSIFYFNLNLICENENKKFTYWPIEFFESIESENLTIIKKVFDQIGYEEVDGSLKDWDIMWSLEYPFDMFADLLDDDLGLKFHKMNHIPGTFYITNKMMLCTTSVSKYIPVGFSFPNDRRKFQNFALLQENLMFVVKNVDHGGVKLIKPLQIDNMELNNERFIQVFIRDPFLIEGHAFEIGIYVLITSLDPLVIYRFTSECLIRFCPDSYYPFDPLNTRKYVVGDENLHFWEIPSFENFHGKFSHLKMFENYFESKNQSVKKFWEQIDDAIVTVTLEKLQLMANELELQCSVYNCSNENFFELLRFDFIIARDGNVKLLEVNLNPDFDGIKNEKKKEHYEQVLYNALRLIGAEGFEIFRQDLRTSSMTSRYEDLSIDFNNCKNCQKSCSNPSCNHCISCFSQDFIKTLHNINREHQKRGNFKRIFPSKIYNVDVDYLSLMTEKTRRLSNWIGFMCNENIDWC